MTGCMDAIVQLSTDVYYNTGITTYIWIISKSKPEHRKGKVQLIDASNRDIIVKAYGEFRNTTYELDGKTFESKIFNNEEFGFNRIQIESPLYDEEGTLVTKGKKNEPVSDPSKKDFENVPLIFDMDDYFDKEVKPYNEEAWIDKSKTKVGYEITFTRYFYKYETPEKSEDIEKRIMGYEAEIMEFIKRLFHEV